MKNLLDIKKVGTHDGVFHADEVTGWVLLQELLVDAELVRTRDKEVLASCDLIFDIGGEDAEFDHHKENREKRTNGIFYSGVGLLWKEFGEKIIKKYVPQFSDEEIEETVRRFDDRFLTSICALDNGQKIFESKYSIHTYSSIINNFNPSWDEMDTSLNDGFKEAVEFATFMFKKELKRAISYIKVKSLIKDAFLIRERPGLLVLDSFMPWKEVLFEIDIKQEVLYVVYPTQDGTYMVQTMNTKIDTFENIKDLPKEWSGKRDKEFEDISGVKGSIFCHVNLFIAGADTLEGAIKLAQIAIGNIICPRCKSHSVKNISAIDYGCRECNYVWCIGFKPIKPHLSSECCNCIKYDKKCTF